MSSSSDSSDFTSDSSTTESSYESETESSSTSSTDSTTLTSSTTSSFDPSPPLPPEPDPAEVEAALHIFLDKKVTPDESLRQPVVHLLSRKKLDALIASDYDLAERYDNEIDSLLSVSGRELCERSEKANKVSIEERAAAAQEKLRLTKEKYDQKRENLKNHKFKATETLNARHKNQSEEFRRKWRTPAFLAKFQRPSSELLEMRLIERRMALSKNYDEAVQARKVANVQQRKEERALQANLEEQMKRDFFRMKDQQAADVERLNKRFSALSDQLELQRTKEIEPIEYYLAELEKKKNAPARKVSQLPKSLMTLGEVDESDTVMLKTSPRTAARYAEFRNDKKVELRVNGVSDRLFRSLLAAYPIVRPPSRARVRTQHAPRVRSVYDDF